MEVFTSGIFGVCYDTLMQTMVALIDELMNDPANVRKHGQRNIETIKASLARFGQQKPIVVDANGVVVAGNGTLAAAKELGWKDLHVVRTGLAGSDRTAYAIADNRTAELAEWDDAALSEQLSALAIDDEELLEAIGYSEKELDKMVSSMLGPDDVVEDEVFDAPAKAVTKPGDLWLLGDHRLLCGDSTNRDHVMIAMGDRDHAELCLTDPPYGVDLNYNADFDDSRDNMRQLIGSFLPMARDLCDVVMLTCGAGRQYDYPEPSWTLCWNIPGAVTSCEWGFCSWQPILAYGKDPYLASGMGRRPDAFSCNTASPDVAHACPKPTKLWAWLMTRGMPSTGGLVLDMFLGSGTSIVVAEQLNRICYGLELSPAYCDVIVERWENLTNGKAKRIANAKR